MTTRRTFLAGLLAAPSMMAFGSTFAQDAEVDLLAKAKAEGEVIYYTSSRQFETEKLNELWAIKYPDVRIVIVNKSAPDLIRQVEAERAANQYHTDVMRMTQPLVAQSWKDREFFAPYKSRFHDDIPTEYADSDGAFYIQGVDLLLSTYNSDLIKDRAELPKSLKDFLDPKWKAKLVIAHPSSAGNSRTYFLGMFQHGKMDWGFLEALAKQDLLFVRGNPDASRMVASGERLISPAISSQNVLPSKQSGQPINFFSLEEGSIVSRRPIGVMNDAPHPNAARLLMDFLLDPEMQTELAKAGQFWPTNSKASPADGMPALSEMKPLEIDDSKMPEKEEAAEFLKRFDEVFGRQ